MPSAASRRTYCPASTSSDYDRFVPRCSVIIPVFNLEQHVAEAVSSALAQTYDDREVIVVNDGSTDRTKDVLQPYFDRIVYLEQPNRGLSAARNRGITAARGEFVALLDADDVWFPGRLGRLVDYLDAHPEIGVVTTPPSSRPNYFRSENQAFWITQYNFMSYMAVIRKDLFSRLGGFDETLSGCEDWELWIRFLAAGERFGAVHEPTALHRHREGSMSYDVSRQFASEKEMLERVVAKGLRLPGLTARLEVARGRAALVEGEPRRARRHFRAAALDRTASRALRVRAAPFVIAPALSWRGYNWVKERLWKRFLGRQGAPEASDVVRL